MNFTQAEENYIKAVYHLQRGTDPVSTNDLAASLSTKPASVTDMLKRLKQKKLLQYEPYQGVRLSTDGRKLALMIIRRHRLWEMFLAEKLKFRWDEVHEIAEELEHVSSDELINRLDEFLGYPKTDPHGDPIPDSKGKIEQVPHVSLDNLPANIPAEVTAITNQSTAMLDMLNHKNIGIGSKVEVKRKFDFDNSLEIKMRNHVAFTISEQVAKNILVKYEN